MHLAAGALHSPHHMQQRHRACGFFAAGVVSACLTVGAGGQSALERTVYVTARDARGGYVGDLAVTDLQIREAGKVGEIVSVQPSGERLRVAVVVDELLAPDTFLRQAVLRFVQAIRPAGDLALHLVGLRNETRVDYTSELYPFMNAINAFPIRAQYPGNLVASLLGIVKYQRPLEGRRAVVVVAPEISQTSSVTADGVFDQLRDSGAVLHVATFIGWRTSGGTLQEQPATRLEGGDLTQVVERDRVLNDGPKRTGGLYVASTRPEGFVAALDRIADDLLHQYRVTYRLPSGTKSDGRVSMTERRKGLQLRGPTRLPET